MKTEQKAKMRKINFLKRLGYSQEKAEQLAQFVTFKQS